MSTISLMFLAILALTVAFAETAPEQMCAKGYRSCSLSGATATTLPPVGPDLSKLYTDLIQAVNPAGAFDSSQPADLQKLVERQDNGSFCCAQDADCLLLSGFGIPFCWDQFTTNYYFPDGSYGSVVEGNYTSASGVNVDLIYGNYERSDGTRGNIYSNAPSMAPDTTTMPVPTPSPNDNTSTAIPASELGSGMSTTPSVATTSSTRITEITLPSTTISIGTSICGHCSFTIIPGLTGLPPVTPTSTVGNPGFPVMTLSSNTTFGTGTASASGSVYTTAIIFPPIFGNNALSNTDMYCGFMVIFSTGVIMWALNN